jgi:hypothetical protein
MRGNREGTALLTVTVGNGRDLPGGAKLPSGTLTFSGTKAGVQCGHDCVLLVERSSVVDPSAREISRADCESTAPVNRGCRRAESLQATSGTGLQRVQVLDDLALWRATDPLRKPRKALAAPPNSVRTIEDWRPDGWHASIEQ